MIGDLSDINEHSSTLRRLVDYDVAADSKQNELNLILFDEVAGQSQQRSHEEMATDEDRPSREDGDRIVREN